MERMRFCPWCGSDLRPRIIDQRERMACTSSSCEYVFWDNPTPVVAAIVEHEGNVLLVRNKGWPPKWYGLVSGFLERGEGPEEAVLREVMEELGLDGEVVSLVGIYPFFRMNQVILAYHVRARGDIRPGEELEDVRSVPPENLKPWDFGTGLAIKDWLAFRQKRRKK